MTEGEKLWNAMCDIHSPDEMQDPFGTPFAAKEAAKKTVNKYLREHPRVNREQLWSDFRDRVALLSAKSKKRMGTNW